MRIPSPFLVYTLTVRQLQEESKTSFLGWLWLLLKPLIQLGIYVVVFGVIFGGRFRVVEEETQLQYALGVFLGMIFVQLITDPLQSAPTLVQQQSMLVKKNAFPLLALPFSRTAAQGVRGLVSLLMWGLAAVFIVPERAGELILIPVMVLPLFLLALGLNAGISSLSVYLGDFGQTVQMLSQLVFWSSGVFYSAVAVQTEAPAIWTVLQWNPVLRMVEESRNLLLWGTDVHWGAVGLSYLLGVVFCLGGCTIFGVLRKGMADFI